MHVAAGRAFWGVDVAMSVDPEQSDFLVLLTVKLRNSGDCPGCNRVIAAQGERNLPRRQGLNDQLRVGCAGLGDLVESICRRVAFGFGLQHRDRNISAVFYLVSHSLEFGLKSSNAHRGRSHVNPAPRLAEIKGNTDDTYVSGFDVL